MCSNEMAVSGRKGDKDLCIGSQDAFEVNCDPCNEVKGVFLKPEGFCNICNEFLCTSCLEVHGRRRKTKNHEVLSGDDMPKSRPAEQMDEKAEFNPAKECTEKCEKHSGQIIRYFCKNHRCVGCMDCIALEHTLSCGSQIVLIADISFAESTEQEFQGFSEKLDQLNHLFLHTAKKAENHVQSAEKHYKKAASDASEFSEEMVNTLHALQNAVEESAFEIKSEDCNKMQRILKQCNSLLREIEHIVSEFESLKKCGRRAQQFTLMKMKNSRLMELEKRGIELEDENFISDNKFFPDEKIKDILTCRTQLGSLITGSNAVTSQLDVPIPSSRKTQSDSKCYQEKKDHKLTVTEYVPPLMEPCKVFVTGLGEATSEECLTLYVGCVYGMEPERVDFCAKTGTAILTFTSKVDFEKLKRGFQRRSLEGNYITANMVEVTRSIKVKGCKSTTSLNSLTSYFENKWRSKGGDVEQAERREDLESCIVTFVNAEDAVRVTQQEGHKLDDQELSISLYYPCLEPDPDTVVSIPEPLELTFMENYMTRFLKGSDFYKEIVEKKIGDLQGKVVWPEKREGCIKLICQVDPKGVGAREKIEQWTDKCGEVIVDILKDLKVSDECSMSKEIWSQFIRRLEEINIANPELLTVFLQQENETLIIVGETALVQAVARQVKDITNDLEKKIEAKRQIVTKSRRVKFYQWALLHALRLPDTWKNSKLEFKLTGETREIVLKGHVKDVDEAIEKMYQRINACPKKSFEIYDKDVLNLLFEPTMRDYINKKLSKKDVIGILDRDMDAIYLYSKNKKDISVAESVLRKCLKQWSIKLSDFLEADTTLMMGWP